MSYRDDRDALDRRVKNLEEDLRVAKDELAERGDDDGRAQRIAAIDAHMAEAQRDLLKMAQELNELRGQPKPARSSRWIFVMAAATVVLGAAAIFLVMSTHVARKATVSPADRAAPTTVVVAPIPKPPVTSAPRPSTPVDARASTVEWRGKVTLAKGSALTIGTPCSAAAELRTTGTQVRVHTVTVTCGGKTIYRSTDKLEGTSSTRAGSEESLEPSSAAPRYSLFYSDTGNRSGERSQVSLNTSASTGGAWVDEMPAWRVEFSLDRWSQLSDGPLLIDRDNTAVRRDATVESISGVGGPVALHAKCAMVAYPVAEKTDQCVVRVSCGETYLYGRPGQGIADCSIQDGAVASASDTKPTSAGGDPMLELDVRGGSLVVSDGPDNHLWAAHLKLADPHP